MKHPEFVVSVALTIAAVFIIGVVVNGDPVLKLKLTFDYGLLTLIFLFGFLILTAIASGKIDISSLLAENGGGASMSRFQLLIFTFVIAISFFLVVVGGAELPKVPGSVLALLGISAGTYGVSKGIQAASPTQGKSAAPTAPTPPAPNTTGGGDAGNTGQH
jgi:hypothetical protein